MSDKMFSDEAFILFQTKYAKLEKDIKALDSAKYSIIGMYQNVIPIDQNTVNEWWSASERLLNATEAVRKDIDELRSLTSDAVANKLIPFEEHLVPVIQINEI